MTEMNDLQVKLKSYNMNGFRADFDIDEIIYDLNSQIKLLSSQADKFDYLISIGSGILCGLLDVLWVGEFSLEHGRNIASSEIDEFVIKTAKLLGCKDDDVESAVKFLERFKIPSDGNTPDFGGTRQHHLRDFAHHPTIVGLMFSILTQFTYKSYGTDKSGKFLIVDVKESSKAFIGKSIPLKILYGTLVWFFHLVSDMAGSKNTAGKSGGTGIPGPILSLAKELSALPFFNEMNEKGDKVLSVFLSKLFNGTLLAKRDSSGKIIKDTELRFDLRAEFGLAIEVGRQAIPVVANECIVRCFYFIRRLALEIQEKDIQSFTDLSKIDWKRVSPAGNPTIARMLTIATGVFTTIDVGEVIITRKCVVSVNFVGVGRFAVAIGQDVSWGLKARKVKRIKQMYEDMNRNIHTTLDEDIYQKIGSNIDFDKFGLTVEQTEILYNLEYLKVKNDIRSTSALVDINGIMVLKHQWLKEWKEYMTKGFASFSKKEGVKLSWYGEKELISLIEQSCPQNSWFRLVLLEAMLFEPYYPLSLDIDKKAEYIPSKKYKKIQNAFSKKNGDEYLNSLFSRSYYPQGYIKRLRKCYDKALAELNEVLKTLLKSLSITAAVALIVLATAGAFAPTIAVALVGSNFAGLSGAALTSACLAYLGGGAIAVGGAGIAGGTIAIVGGGAILGLGIGTGVGGAVGAVSLLGRRNTILQSAKLIVSIKEIFLNDEHDTVYSNSVYEEYVQKIVKIEKGIVDLRNEAEVITGKEKKDLNAKIKEANETVKVMKIARNELRTFISSFEEGMNKV